MCKPWVAGFPNRTVVAVNSSDPDVAAEYVFPDGYFQSLPLELQHALLQNAVEVKRPEDEDFQLYYFQIDADGEAAETRVAEEKPETLMKVS